MGDYIYDVCIVGAGMFGSAAARHASSNPALKVCLIGPREPTAKESEQREIYSSHYDEGRIVEAIDNLSFRQILYQNSIRRYWELENLSGIRFYNPVGALTVGERHGVYIKNLLQSLASNQAPFIDLSNKHLFTKRFPYLNFEDRDYPLFDDNGAGYISARKMVDAEKEVSRQQGCEIIEDVVCEVSELVDSVHTVVMEQNGCIRSRRVLFCTGAFTNFKKFHPVKRLNIKLCKEAVTMLKVSETEAKRLRSMPVINYIKRNDRMLSTITGAYILPPIRYPDGKYYLKAGPIGNVDHPKIETLQEIKEWYHSKGFPEVVNPLTELLQEIVRESIAEDQNEVQYILADYDNPINGLLNHVPSVSTEIFMQPIAVYSISHDGVEIPENSREKNCC